MFPIVGIEPTQIDVHEHYCVAHLPNALYPMAWE